MKLKQVLIYWAYYEPKGFSPNPIVRSHVRYSTVQVDNLLDLGYSPDDLILATNFDWEYKGVKAVPLTRSGAETSNHKTSSKILGVKELIENGIIHDDDTVYWVHDFDVFQNMRFIPEEMNNYNLGLVPFSSSNKGVTTCSFFIKPKSYWIIDELCKRIANFHGRRHGSEELFLNHMMQEGFILKDKDYIELNRTYGYSYKAHSRFSKGDQSILQPIIDSIIMPLRAVDFNCIPYSCHSRFWKRRTEGLSERLRKLLYEPLGKWN